jgi:hypothetical protein
MEGMISNHHVSILIDLGSNLSYVTPQTIEKCKLKQLKHTKSWLVQLATGTKRMVTDAIPTSQFIMNGLPTRETLNMLPLGYYDLLIGMALPIKPIWTITIKLWSVKMEKGQG